MEKTETDILEKVHYKKSSKARYIRISIKPEVGIVVTVPYRNSIADAEKFVSTKLKWINKHLEKNNKLIDKLTVFNQNIKFKTKEHELIFIQDHLQHGLKIKIKHGQIKFSYPQTINIENFKVQNFIRKGIEEAWRIEAKKYLPQRVSILAEQYGFKYNSVSIRNSTTRWGSCSYNNNINLSLHLMRLPDKFIDYIILHELSHTVHKNHKKNFRKMIERVCPEAKLIEKEMRNYRTKIY